MEKYQHTYQQQQQQMMGGSALVVAGETSASGDRFPQWSAQETNEFLLIRAELDRTFMETKRNKVLWEVMAARLKEKGFSRSAEQCKSKWKNLVTRYKGCETMEPEAMRQQFPFYNELHAIFSSRLQQMLWAEAEGYSAATIQGGVTSSTVGKKRKALATTSKHMSSDDEDEDEDSEGENNKGSRKIVGRKKTKKTKSEENGWELRELLEGFMKEQAEMEARWREVYEAREEEWRRREETWRRTMEALQEERRRMERSWREREEQRWVREEARSQKRDALITQLLNRLRRGDDI